MDSTTNMYGHDAPDSSPMLDTLRAGVPLKPSKVVKAEAESATMGSPVSASKDSCSPPHYHGDVTPTKTTTSLSTRVERIRDSLEGSISDDAKKRIENILDDVKQLSDVEKLLLYLRLPTGTRTKDIPPQTPSSLHLSNLEHAQAFTWIQSHLEEDNETCLRKDEVFDDYRNYCDSNNMKPLNTADFGKVMKRAFPNVKPRRLGQRGQSKYCYSGLRKRLEVQPPSLPDLGECFETEAERQKTEDEELMPECIALVCEWADNLLGKSFTNVRELSEHLLSNLYVNSKSTAAFALTAAMQKTKKKDSKVPVSSLFATKTNTCSKGDTQIQIQRRIQEREMLREQKKKLQKQRDEHGGKEEKRKGVKKLFSPPQPKSEFPEQQTSCAMQGMSMEPWYPMGSQMGHQMMMSRIDQTSGSAFSSVNAIRPMMGHPHLMPGVLPHIPLHGPPHGPPLGPPHGPPHGLSHGPPHGPPHGLSHGPPHGPPMSVSGSMHPSTLEELLDPGPPKSSHEHLAPSSIASGNPELAQALLHKQFTPIKLQPKTVSSMLKEQRGFGQEGEFFDGRSVATLLKDTRDKEFNSNMKRVRDDPDQGSATKRQHLDYIQDNDNIIDYFNSSGDEQMLRGMQKPASNPGFPGRPPSNSQFGRPPRPPSNSNYPNRPPSNSGYPNRPPSNSGYPARPPSNSGYPARPPSDSGYPARPPSNSGYPARNIGGMYMPPQQKPLVRPPPPYSHHNPVSSAEYHTFQTQQMNLMTSQRFDKPVPSPSVPMSRQRSNRGSTGSPPPVCTSNTPYRVFPGEPQYSQAKPMVAMSYSDVMHHGPRGMAPPPPHFTGTMPTMGRHQMPDIQSAQPPFPNQMWLSQRPLVPTQAPPGGAGPPRPPEQQGSVSDDLQSTLDVLRDFDTQYFNQSSDLEDSNNSLTKLIHQNQNDLSAMTSLQESVYIRRQSEANQVVPPDGMTLTSDSESIMTYENLTGPKLGNRQLTH